MSPPEARLEVDLLAATCGELGLRGSWYGSCNPQIDIPMLVDLVATGRLQPVELVSWRGALGEVNDALDRLRAGTAGRSLLLLG